MSHNTAYVAALWHGTAQDPPPPPLHGWVSSITLHSLSLRSRFQPKYKKSVVQFQAITRHMDKRLRFHDSNHLCLQGANEPLPMLLFSALANCDMSFLMDLAHCTVVGREGLRVA